MDIYSSKEKINLRHQLIYKAFNTGNAKIIAKALGDAAKTIGMTNVSKKTGLAREQLYVSLSETGNPSLKTILAVLEVMEISLTIKDQKE